MAASCRTDGVLHADVFARSSGSELGWVGIGSRGRVRAWSGRRSCSAVGRMVARPEHRAAVPGAATEAVPENEVPGVAARLFI